MSEPQDRRYDSIARRWLALVERRQEHFIELADTGRWRHYYTQTGFIDEMRKVLHVRDQWAAIAGLPPAEPDADQTFGASNGRNRPVRLPAPLWQG